ncbi:nucleoside hydrolase [Sinorhizobium meliloti]|nr:nucleoside hydrolase [Sinorhizobium meliloti]MDE4591139.1 nucleoside hydrolase [Sinorhizobium meliloti]
MSDYPKRHSDVDVVFVDGTVQTYRITAGAGIAPHLAKQAGETGILTLLCGAKAYSFPIGGNVREWTITELDSEPEASE